MTKSAAVTEAKLEAIQTTLTEALDSLGYEYRDFYARRLSQNGDHYIVIYFEAGVGDRRDKHLIRAYLTLLGYEFDELSSGPYTLIMDSP